MKRDGNHNRICNKKFIIVASLLLFLFIFNFSSISALNISLISPDDESIYVVLEDNPFINISFISNITGSETLINASLLINGVINQTNISEIKGQYNFTQQFTSGSYNWKIRAFNQTDIKENSTHNGSAVNVFSGDWNTTFYILKNNVYLGNFRFSQEGENLSVTIYKNNTPIFNQSFNNLTSNTNLLISLNRNLYSSLLNQGDVMILNLKKTGAGAGVYLDGSTFNITTNLTSSNQQFNKGVIIDNENKIRHEFIQVQGQNLITQSEQRVFGIEIQFEQNIFGLMFSNLFNGSVPVWFGVLMALLIIFVFYIMFIKKADIFSLIAIP